MSVVNRMLQDLDERRVPLADTVFEAEPPVTTALVPRSRNLPRTLAAVSVMIAVLGAVKAWTWAHETAPATPARDETAPWAQSGAWVESAAIDAWVREQAPAAPVARRGTAGSRVAPASDAARSRAPDSREISAREVSTHEVSAREVSARADAVRDTPARADAPEAQAARAAGGTAVPATGTASRRTDPSSPERPAETIVAGIRVDAAQEREAKPAKSAPADSAKAAGAADPARIERSSRTTGADSGPEAAYRQGLARYNAGDFAAAAQLFRIALAEDPRFASARRALAALYVDRRDWAQAQSVLAEGLAIDPRNAQFAQLSAQISMRAGDPDAAIRTLQSAAGESSPAELNATLAGLLARARRDREAVPYWMAALKRSPMQGEWWLGLAIALEADARPGDARPAYERALALGRLAAESADFARERLANLR